MLWTYFNTQESCFHLILYIFAWNQTPWSYHKLRVSQKNSFYIICWHNWPIRLVMESVIDSKFFSAKYTQWDVYPSQIWLNTALRIENLIEMILRIDSGESERSPMMKISNFDKCFFWSVSARNRRFHYDPDDHDYRYIDNIAIFDIWWISEDFHWLSWFH